MTSKFRNIAIAGAAGIAMIAAGSMAAPTEAQAGGKIAGAIVGGLVAGAIIGHVASRPAYATPVYGYAPVHCTWQNHFKGYDVYGRAVYHRVKVCG